MVAGSRPAALPEHVVHTCECVNFPAAPPLPPTPTRDKPQAAALFALMIVVNPDSPRSWGWGFLGSMTAGAAIVNWGLAVQSGLHPAPAPPPAPPASPPLPPPLSPPMLPPPFCLDPTTTPTWICEIEHCCDTLKVPATPPIPSPLPFPPLPPTPPPLAPCTDLPGYTGLFVDRVPQACSDVQVYCLHPAAGPKLRVRCPVTCGSCDTPRAPPPLPPPPSEPPVLPRPSFPPQPPQLPPPPPMAPPFYPPPPPPPPPSHSRRRHHHSRRRRPSHPLPTSSLWWNTWTTPVPWAASSSSSSPLSAAWPRWGRSQTRWCRG